MKRVFLIFLSFFLLLFSGCGDFKNPPKVPENFDALVSVQKKASDPDDYILQAEITVENRSMIEISVISPKEISGLSFVWDGADFEMVYENLHCKTEADYLPSFAFSQVIYNVLQVLYEKPHAESVEIKEVRFAGTCDSGSFEVLTDGKGYVKNISVKEINLSADFIYE